MGLVAPVSAGPPKPLHVAHLEFNGFFPGETKIRVGDSVSFSINGFHTVTFLSGAPQPGLIVPAPESLIEGKLDGEGKSFWFNGKPNQVINPVVAAPAGAATYNGTGFLNSGLPAGPPKAFVVTFTKAGTFKFNCLVHPGMQGTVKVLPKGRTVPSAAKDLAQANSQAARTLNEAKGLARNIHPGSRTVLAGRDGQGAVSWWKFFPEHLKIKAGTTVNFKLDSTREVHTITFGPAAFTGGIEETFTTVVPRAGGPPTVLVDPLAAYPSDPGPPPPYTGTNHGNGFENAGILAKGGPLPSSVKITFTKPGVFKFECVIHPHMDGTITVTK
jgi:plastocyanin